MGNLSNYYAKEGKQNPYISTTGSVSGQSSTGGGLLQQYQKKNNLPSPFSVAPNKVKPVQVAQPKSSPSLISSAPQIISGIAKGINIGKLIITAATRQATQPQIDVSKVQLPTPQPQATPQKTISITPNQKILTPQQLKVVTPAPVSGSSATMKQAKPGSPTIISRAAAVIPQTTAQVKDTATTVKEFIKSPAQFKSKATYDANNTTGLVKDRVTRKVTDFLNLPREAPAMIKAAVDAVSGAVGQGISLAMQERLSPPKTAGELVGLKAKQITNAITIGLSPINALFAAADKTPYVSELMRAVTIPFLAAGEITTKASDKIIDSLPISQQAKNNIKGPIGELAALTAQIALGHSLAKISGKGMSKLNETSKTAFTTLTKDIIETNGGKGTVSFTPADVRKVAVFNEGGKYHKALVDILAQEGKNAGDLWTKAVKEGITIELPFEKVIGMVDKPWWGKIKKFLNAGVTDATTTTQVPGRIVGPATEGAAPAVSIEKKITALLPENINHNPQAVINAVIKGGLEKTVEGKALVKSALEAQQKGTDLVIKLDMKGLDAETNAKIEALNVQDANNPVAEGNVRVYQSVGPGMTTDFVFKSPEELARFKNNVTAPEETFQYIDVKPEQITAVEGKKGVFKIATQDVGSSQSDAISSQIDRALRDIVEAKRLMADAPATLTPEQDANGVKDKVWYDNYIKEVERYISKKEKQQQKVIDQVSTPPEDALKQEALKYKSAEEFVKAIQANPEKIPTTPEYQKYLQEKDDFVKKETSIYDEMEAMRDKYSKTTIDKVSPVDVAKYENLQKELNKTLSAKTLAKAPEGIIRTDIGEKGLASQLTDFWNKAQAPKVEPIVETPQPKAPEALSPTDLEAAKARLEAKVAASAEMDKIPTNTDAQTPVGTGELKKSKAYTRVFDLLKSEFQQEVSYNVLNLEKDAKNAVDFIAKDPKAAIRVGLGLEQPPEGQTETAISIALAEKAATEGDHALQSRLESSRSLRQTRRGQEIVSERGRFGDDSAHKYMRELLNKRLSDLGANVRDAIAETMNRATSTKQAAMEKIDKEVKKIDEAIKRDRKKIQAAQDIINSLICK